ncbi:MAG: hypothetical protein KC535_01835 [Nanoarchaeota archaeon]|nr:hypothetical protein [Nanoarchaeota archaeon]
MEVTNKTLGLLLIAAIVVSLGGTFVSLNKLGGVSTTGYATNNETGTVTLAVGTALSIVTVGNTDIAFGTCTPDTASAITVDSSLNSAGVNNTLCDGTFPDNITIENDGNVDANVTVRSSINGTDFFDTNGNFEYKVNNVSGDGGCDGIQAQTTFNSFALAATDYPTCSNFTYVDANDQMQFSARFTIPANTVSSIGPATVTFEARISTG